jgi:PHD/YefM family antitoxin component YafN of YafNO toxin-antitoxin module
MTIETHRVGIREFRQKLSSYLLDSESPLAIVRHGDTVGYYIPVRRKRTEEERMAFLEAAAKFQKILDAKGITEEDIREDFKRWRAGKRK